MCKDKFLKIPSNSFERIPLYLSVLKNLESKNVKYISSSELSKTLNENASVIKKDLSFLTTKEGKPKVGYEVKQLICDIEEVLGFKHSMKAIIVGIGTLGTSLLKYTGFEEKGLNIVAGFDVNKNIIGSTINGKMIYHSNEIKSFVSGKDIKFGIITTPAAFAQETANALVECGIQAIWNFTPSHLEIPKDIVVRNENLATSFAILSQKLQEKLMEDSNGKE